MHREEEGILHAQEKINKKTNKKQRNKKETTATHLKVATSATGRKRPRQLTTTEHIIEEIGSLLGTRARIITRREVFFSLFFLSLFSAGGGRWVGAGFQNDISVKCKNTAAASALATFPVSPLPTTL